MENDLLHCLQDSVGTYGIELEDRGSKTLHKVPTGLGSPHLYVEKTSDALLSPDLAHVLSDKFLDRKRKKVTYFEVSGGTMIRLGLLG